MVTKEKAPLVQYLEKLNDSWTRRKIRLIQYRTQWEMSTCKKNYLFTLRQVFCRVYRLEIANFFNFFAYIQSCLYFQPSFVICTLPCCPVFWKRVSKYGHLTVHISLDAYFHQIPYLLNYNEISSLPKEWSGSDKSSSDVQYLLSHLRINQQ